jgi:hypothetical protein
MDATYAAIATELHRIADALATLGPDMPRPHVAVTLSSSTSVVLDDETRMAAIDAIAIAVTGKPGELGQKFKDGARRYGTPDTSGPLFLSIFDTVADPAERSELERLRAEAAAADRPTSEEFHRLQSHALAKEAEVADLRAEVERLWGEALAPRPIAAPPSSPVGEP